MYSTNQFLHLVSTGGYCKCTLTFTDTKKTRASLLSHTQFLLHFKSFEAANFIILHVALAWLTKCTKKPRRLQGTVKRGFSMEHISNQTRCILVDNVLNTFGFVQSPSHNVTNYECAQFALNSFANYLPAVCLPTFTLGVYYPEQHMPSIAPWHNRHAFLGIRLSS